MNPDDFERLRQSPLFQLSLASRELFHSNFLAWLFERHPNWVGPVLGTAPEHRHWRLGKKGVRREERNLDLVLHLDCGSTLIVENKVKSVPDRHQLDEYQHKLKKLDAEYPSRTLLLLTLSRGDDPAAEKWAVLTYGDVAERLTERAGNLEPGYERALIEDYAGFIRVLSALGQIDEQHDWIDKRPELRELRIPDLLQKRKATWLARKLAVGLRAHRFPRLAGPSRKATELEVGELFIYDSLTNGNGLVGFVLVVSDGPKLPGARALPRYGVGVQIQGNQYRSFIQLLRPERPSEETIAAFRKLALELFAHSPLPGWWPAGAQGAGRKDLCTYGGVFLYRYQQLLGHPSDESPTLASLAERLLASALTMVGSLGPFQAALENARAALETLAATSGDANKESSVLDG